MVLQKAVWGLRAVTMTQQKQRKVIVYKTWMWAGPACSLREGGPANIARKSFSARTVSVKAIFIISIINNRHNYSCDQ